MKNYAEAAIWQNSIRIFSISAGSSEPVFNL